MARVWSMSIDLNDPEDRRVATWLAAQPAPAVAVKKLILATAAGQEPSNRLIDLVPSILQEVRALRSEVSQVRASGQPDPLYEAVLHELRALRADLARVGPKELGKVQPPPEDPESAWRLDNLFSR
jgi:hypothetical protein